MHAALVALALLLAAGTAHADLGGGDPTRDYAPNERSTPTTWFVRADPAAQAADAAYVRGMRAHHAGALTMSEEYLADPAARSATLRRLAHSIVANQAFEIALLDDVAARLAEPPVRFGPLRLQAVATDGLGPLWGFQKRPIPGMPDLMADGAPSARDVLFAKAMTIHHQAALDMAAAYRANPAATNGYLRWLNVGIVTDQTQEIALMQAVIRRYPGDAAALIVTPDMVHGMDDHAGHGGAAREATAQAATPPAPNPTDAHGGHGAGQPHAGHGHGTHAAPAPPPAAGAAPRPRPTPRENTHRHTH